MRLHVLWNLPSYERLVGVWNLGGEDATRAITVAMTNPVQAIEDDAPPAR
jgi:hypothetical protein